MTWQQKAAMKQGQVAYDKYDKCYSYAFYRMATYNRSSAYENALIREAYALCGHPAYRVSKRKWNKLAIQFLQRFVG